MLKKLRIAFAAIFLLGITLLFVGIGHEWWGWMAKLQFLPSCLALNFIVVGAILLLTLVFGRLYCSVICPMGVYQDVVLAVRKAIGKWMTKRSAKRFAKTRKGKPVNYRKTFKFNKERRVVRYVVFAAFLVCLIAGLQAVIALIAPYSAYGRMIRSFAGIGNAASPAALTIVGIVTFLVITVLAAAWGRTWCNTICPVGTFLSFFSRFAILRPMIDESKCTGCHSCEKNCKSACINSDVRKIDYSRCVDCFDCIDTCSSDAIKMRFAYGRKPESDTDKGRRNFLATTALLVGTASLSQAQEKKVDGGLADVTPKQAPERSSRLVPPGAGSVKSFYDKCTACQLCVTNCPNGVLRPSTDIEHLLQPQMSYENGFCRPECTTCSSLCPAGAIRPVSKEEKTLIHIGTAAVNAELCIACGKCKTACPTGAVMMVTGEDGKRVAAVAEEQCIGCGKCEFLCPVRPISAIIVNGKEEHRNG